MRALTLIFVIISSVANAEGLCKEFPIDKDAIYTWSEDDFSKEDADTALASVQLAMINDGEIGTCELPNSMTVIEGYILKQQAIKALAVSDLDDGLKQYYRTAFCEFVRNNGVCE